MIITGVSEPEHSQGAASALPWLETPQAPPWQSAFVKQTVVCHVLHYVLFWNSSYSITYDIT
jgi:hypothetical protein